MHTDLVHLSQRSREVDRCMTMHEFEKNMDITGTDANPLLMLGLEHLLISVTSQKGQGHKGQVNYVDWSAHEPYRLCHCCFYICHHFSSVRNSFIFFRKKL